jgi:hypothetical protein
MKQDELIYDFIVPITILCIWNYLFYIDHTFLYFCNEIAFVACKYLVNFDTPFEDFKKKIEYRVIVTFNMFIILRLLWLYKKSSKR